MHPPSNEEGLRDILHSMSEMLETFSGLVRFECIRFIHTLFPAR